LSYIQGEIIQVASRLDETEALLAHTTCFSWAA